MTEVDNTNTVLYHYLRTLFVKVSRSTVHRLLDTPVGDSMRGISDAWKTLGNLPTKGNQIFFIAKTKQ